jgi:2-dehydro-3-deoxygalactonokinase
LTSEGAFIAGDWGTSNMRLFLCDAQGKVLDSTTGPGVAGSAGRCAEIYDSLTSKWTGTAPAILCGMVGSNIGWVQAPYAACPATLAEIAGHSASLRGGAIRIVPGLSCRNRFDAPDFMRGEETQILGALALAPALRHGRQLLCLPGTHTKWALLTDAVVTEFLTAPTGELFNLLSNHSVLVREGGEVSGAAFGNGLQQFARFPRAQLLDRLFECRSRTLDGELAPHEAAAFLSGLLVASDIAGALETFGEQPSVHLIGSPNLTRLYAEGLRHRQCVSSTTDGSAASLAGLDQIRKQLSGHR